MSSRKTNRIKLPPLQTLADMLPKLENECKERGDRLRRGFKIGSWEYDPMQIILVCTAGGYDYVVDVTRMSTCAALLDWIIQVSKKTWATPVVIGELVMSLNELFNIQAVYCGGGVDLTTKNPVDARDHIVARSAALLDGIPA